MTVQIRLTEEQASVVRTLAAFVRLSESETLLACAILSLRTEWENASTFRAEVHESHRWATSGRMGRLDPEGCLPCGVLVRQPPRRQIIQRAFSAFYRDLTRRALTSDDTLPSGVSFDAATGVVALGKGGPKYRWTGRRVRRVEN